MIAMRSVARSLTVRARVRPATLRLLLVLVLLVMARGTMIWWKWSDRVAMHIQQSDHRLDADEETVKAFAARADTIALIEHALIANNDRFIFAPTVAQTTTMTASLVASEALAAGIRLGTIDIQADSVFHDGVRMTIVDGEASGTFSSTVAFLRALDRGNPFYVRRFAINPASASNASNQLMQVRFAVVGLARHPFEFER